MLVWAVPCSLTLTAIPSGFDAEVFTGRLPFLYPNQQHWSPRTCLDARTHNNFVNRSFFLPLVQLCGMICRLISCKSSAVEVQVWWDSGAMWLLFSVGHTTTRTYLLTFQLFRKQLMLLGDTGNVLDCPDMMDMFVTNEEGKTRGNCLTQVWPLK